MLIDFFGKGTMKRAKNKIKWYFSEYPEYLEESDISDDSDDSESSAPIIS